MKKNIKLKIEENVNYIFDLYFKKGHIELPGQSLSILEHSIQTAKFARKAGGKNYMILAAFLHDIGHLIIENEPENKAFYGHFAHEKIGASKILELGFSEKLAALILNHVQAKRYLVTKFPDYINMLSEASLATLNIQGGKMDKLEMENFEQKPMFKQNLLLRIWDDKAKVSDQHIPDLSYFYDMATKHIRNSKMFKNL